MVKRSVQKVFIGSTNADLEEYREKVRDVLISLNCLPIMNEYWPAMDSSAVEACMFKVDSADIYIGIYAHRYGHCPIGSEISITEMEFNQARSLKIPCLCFLVDENFQWTADHIEGEPGKSKLRRFKAQLDESLVRKKFTTPDSLATAVSLALDEFWQNEYVDNRLMKLKAMYKESKARCVGLWYAAGATRETSELMADDLAIGRPFPQLQSKLQYPVMLLVADIGSGKSLIIERLLQIAIEQAKNDLEAPIPIYFNNKQLPENFQEVVRSKSEGLGDIDLQGASIFIDEADARGIDYINDLLIEAHIAAKKWRGTTTIIASRPMPGLSDNVEKVTVPKLSEAETIRLLKRISGDWIHDHYLKHYSSSIREALARPLFAILLGGYLNTVRRHEKYFSTGNLITNLVEQSIRNLNQTSFTIDNLLKKLAFMVIERNGRFVPSDELAHSVQASRDKLSRLTASRLIIAEQRAISFALPILTEWFGALSLLDGEPSIDELKNDKDKLERWRFPLIIAVSNFAYNRTKDTLAAIAKTDPGFASEIIHDALSRNVAGPNQESFLPSEEECKDRVEFTMNTWIKSLGALACLIAPVNGDGSLWRFDVGISKSSDITWLSIFWDSEEQELAHSSRAPLQDTWAWRWTWEHLSRNLSKLISNHSLPVEKGILYKESLARIIAAVLGRGEWFPPYGVSLDDLEARLNNAGGYLPSTKITATTYINDKSTLDRVWAHITYLREKGETNFVGIWHKPDQPQELYRLGSFFSDDRLLERTNAIYLAAIEGYQTLVTEWFPLFAQRLPTFCVLPAILKGIISNGYISWYFEPLPIGSQNQVDIKIGSGLIKWTDLEWDLALKNYEALRPRRVPKLSIRHERLDVFKIDPATHLAYSWLESDLKDIHWI